MNRYLRVLFVSVVFVNLILDINASEIQDVTAVHIVRPHGGSYMVETEIHSRTNALGYVFSYDNGTFLVPATSKMIPNFQCFYSEHKCEWTHDGSWTTHNLTSKEFKMLSLQNPVPSCDFNNGGCQIHCNSTYSRQSECSCPPHYRLEPNKTCSASSSVSQILSPGNGRIGSPNWPGTYYNNIRRSWLIVSEMNTRINYEVPEIFLETNYDILTVDNGNGNQTFTGTLTNIKRTSQKNFMVVYFVTDSSNVMKGFLSTYKSEAHPKLKALRMTSAVGRMTLPLDYAPRDMCLSLVYKLGSAQPPEIKVEHSSSKYTTLLEISKKVVDGWTISRHATDTPLNTTDKPMNLIVTWKGENTIVFNIIGCDSKGEEDVYTLYRETWTPKHFPQLTNASAVDKLKCSNGGIFHEKSRICVCPPGFAGEKCEDACGSNRYGRTCDGVCSWLGEGCKGMIFCNNYNVCTCATGYSGIACDHECSTNYYGPNCNIQCGKCNGGSCDKFTGECIDGCRDGYFPPTCQDEYLKTLNAPRLTQLSFHYVSMNIDLQNLTGKGTPHLYAVQYKKNGPFSWTNGETEVIPDEEVISVNLTGLDAGTSYLARVIIINKDGNSHQGSNIPNLRFETNCEVPDSANYEIKHKYINSTEFTIEWKYNFESDKWCPVYSYDVILEERWRKFYSEVPADELAKATFTNLWPYREYKVYICAKSHRGRAPCSPPFATTTNGTVPRKVMYLTVDSTSPRNIHISWKKPLFPHGMIKGYRIQYQCLKYFVCNDACSHSHGTFETTQTSAIIAGLLPYSRYKVRVAAFTSGQGPFRDVFAITQSAIPDNNPIKNENPVTSLSNTSAVVQWNASPCYGMNGNFKEYFLTVAPKSDNSNATIIGRTTNTTAKITGLRPKENYEVNVYTVNTHGWNPKYKLTIDLSTHATVPDAVSNLEVYKKGRRMIGLRWGKPTKIYGDLKSFTITYRLKDGTKLFEKSIPPTPCLSWPDLYCYTINSNLQPDKHYMITVKARNSEINEDGVGAEITTQCRENAPDPPSYLNILETNSTSFSMEWGVPNSFNGELRSFLVNVEHIDALTEEECCEYFPVQELPFREENSSFSLQVDGLVPASTYIASVSAKTILLGPSANATFTTAPLPLSYLPPPQVTNIAGGKTYSVEIMRYLEIIHPKLKSLYLLLMLHEHANVTSDIWKNDVLRKLNAAVNNRKFYIISEFEMDDPPSEENIVIGTGREIQNGTIGEIKDPVLTPGDYRIGLAALLSYGDATSVTFAEGDIFTVD